MGNIYIDLDSVVNSFSNIYSLNQSVHSPVISTLKTTKSNIDTVSSEHDGCFDSVTLDGVFNSSENIFNDIDSFLGSIRLCILKLYNYSLSDGSELGLFDLLANSGEININGDLNFEKVMQLFPDKTAYEVLLSYFHDPNMSLQEKISGIELTDLYNNKTYDPEKYNALLSNILSGAKTEREKVVASGLFLAMVFPHISYFYGGEHGHFNTDSLSGVDGNWGVIRHNSSNGKNIPYSLDCSSFVSWCLFNSNTKETLAKKGSTVRTYEKNIGSTPISSEVMSKLRPGDLVTGSSSDPHIGLVVDVNYSTNQFTVAHVSGSGKGMNFTVMDASTGLCVNDTSVAAYKENSPRVGSKYFRNVIYMDYDDETPQLVYNTGTYKNA